MEKQSQKLPSVFISHQAIGYTLDPTFIYFRVLQSYSKSQKLPEKSKNVIIVSSHWEESEVTVNFNPTPTIMHDHNSDWLYKYNFRFETNVELAQKVKERFEANKIKVNSTATRDIDHGAWGGLFALFDIEKHSQVYEESKISFSPKIVQVSLHSGMDTAFHYRMGEILNEFRNEETMIITSGASTHSVNHHRNAQFNELSKAWEKYLLDVITNKNEKTRKEKLFSIKKHKQYSTMHHSDDHFIPLLVSLGTSHDAGTLIAQDKSGIMNMVYSSYQFM